ncbi:MAG: DUF2007 domain-containing protein [Actinomycetota bacterium]|nr:DUF2007 domain-containing protein [Actinomycetota bacterium]
MQQARMVRLATVGSSFHARVIAARLGAEGIITTLRGNVDGLYPVGDVHVYVDEEDLAEAQELLMADEVESAFDEPDEAWELRRRERWLVVGAVFGIFAVMLARMF